MHGMRILLGFACYGRSEMHIHHGYRFEGLIALIVWAAFFALVLIFDEETRRLKPWAFLVLMALIIGASVIGENILYRLHSRRH